MLSCATIGRAILFRRKNRLGWCYIILKSKNRRLVVSSSEARLMVERRRKTAGIRLFGSKYGMPDTIRTYDLQLRKLTLYPTELRAHMWINPSKKDEITPPFKD